MPKTIKEFLKLFGPLALGIVLVASWFLHSRSRIHEDILSQRQETVVTQASRMVTIDMESRTSDARFLARLVALKFQDNHHGQELQELADIFTDFTLSRPFYFQVRFLDERGRERIRIESSPNGPIVVPQDKLQEKVHRYYFTEAIRAGKDEVYISNFDLNIEHGKVELPHRPTLRFACPVIDKKGKKLGAIVLNYCGQAILDQLKKQTRSAETVTMLCNGQGYWLLGPETDDAWGHALKERSELTMGNRFPVAWERIAAHTAGQIITENGLFSYSTIGIIPNHVFMEKPPTSKELQSRWKVIIWASPEQLTLSWQRLFSILTAIFLAILAASCWHLAHYRVNQAKVEAKLRESEEQMLAISQSSQDSIVMVDAKDHVTYWNPAASKLFGYSSDDILGRKLHEFLTDKPLCQVLETTLGLLPPGQDKAAGKIIEFEARHISGNTIPVELSISCFELKGNWFAVGSMRDITRRKADEALLREMATTDSLTGLNNRRRFMELAEQEFIRSKRYGRELSLLMIDIDHFKQVNDTHGHDVGDEVLRGLSEISILALRESDILGRLGGEEFGVLLPETHGASAQDVAERLRLSVERSCITTNAGRLCITVSIGVGVISAQTQSLQHLLKKADVALYEAKRSGRNRMVVG